MVYVSLQKFNYENSIYRNKLCEKYFLNSYRIDTVLFLVDWCHTVVVLPHSGWKVVDHVRLFC